MNNKEYKKEMEREMLLNIEIEKNMLKSLAPKKQTRKNITVSKNPEDKRYQQEMEREYLLNIQIEKELYAALPKQNVSKQLISPLTQEMIDDYKKQFKRPGYLFNITSDKPQLETVNDLILDDEFNETELNDKMDDLKKYTNELVNYENVTIPAISKKIIANTLKYNLVAESYNPRDIIKARQLLKDNEQLEDDILDIKDNKIPRLKGSINTLNQEIRENDINKESNIAKINNMEYNNKRKINEYTETLRMLTNGINMTQQEGETEQDFLNRLYNIANIPDDPTEAILFNMTLFKKNMRTILDQDWMIENILKSINNVTLHLLNMTFPKFKKKFMDDFGLFNRNFGLDDYTVFINYYIDTELKSDISYPADDTESFYSLRTDRSLRSYRSLPSQDEDKIDSNTVEPPEVENESSSVEMDPETLKKIEDFKRAQVEEYKELTENNIKSSVQVKNKRKPTKKANELNLKSVEDFDVSAETSAPAPAPAQKEFPILQNTSINIITNGDGEKTVRFTDNNNHLLFLTPYKKQARYSESVKFSYDNSNYQDIAKNSSGAKTSAAYIRQVFGKDPPTNSKNKLTKPENANFKMDTNDFKLVMNYISKEVGKKLKEPRISLLYNYLTQLIQSGSGIKKQKKKPTVHKGKSLKDVPSHCEFGKLILLLNKLYHKNILSVKDANNVNVQGIPNSKVSNDFVNLLMKICTDKNITKKDISLLNQKEMILYNVLISKAGLSKDFDVDIKKTIKTLKNRFQLIEGQIVAGNNNDDLKKQLYDVVFKLSHIGAISISAARKYYNDTLKLYFKK